MLSLERAQKSQTIFHPLTGLNVDTFNELMENLEKAYPEFEKKKHLSRPNRKRAIGAGGKFKLPLPERVFMTPFSLDTTLPMPF